MATKKKTVKKTVKKTTQPTMKKPATKSTPKVDVVEEAKKELKNLEAQAAKKDKKKFPWGVFIGAVLLTCAVILLVTVTRNMVMKNRITKQLTEIIAPLAGGMEIENIGKLEEKSGIYQFTLKFAGYDEEYWSSITKDGKIFFANEGISVDEILGLDSNSAAAGTVDTATCESLTKSDDPNLSVYVSSDCGHCKQAEAAIASAVKQVPALAKRIHLHYASVISDGEVMSFLGSQEGGQENLRQVCIREEQPNVYWDYVGCMAEGGESATCMSTAKIATAQVDACMADNTRGLAFLQADVDLTNSHEVTGTPSFYMNDTEAVTENDFGGRAAEAYKQMICCGSNTQADYCATTLE